MYKLLIVDDEPLVRMGLKAAVDWEGNGYEVVGEAASGSQALAYVENLHPHIVITDIRMPGMDGIELIRQVRERQLGTKFIVLSNYDDFHLVKEALKCGASDYFLKVTMETDKLLESLAAVCGQIDAEAESRKDRLMMSSTLHDHKAQIKSRYFYQLIHGKMDEEGIARFVQESRLKLFDPQGTLFVVRVDNSRAVVDGRFQGDEELFVYTLASILEEIVAKFGPSEVFEHDTSTYVLILSGNHAGKRHIAEQIQGLLQQYLNLASGTIYNLSFASYSDLKRLLKSIPAFAEHFFYAEQGTIWDGKELPEISDEAWDLYVETKKELALGARHCQDEQTAEAFADWHRRVRERRIRPKLVRELTRQLLIAVQDEMPMLENSWQTHMTALDDELKRADHIDPLMRTAEAYRRELLMQSVRNAQVSRSEILKAKHYMEAHSDRKLTLDEVAKRVNMNKSYFCRLFKEQTGENFKDYLLRLKMERATTLIRQTDKKISEIALDLGYGDIFYFNRVYKKFIGSAPTEIRKQRLEEGRK